MFRMLKAYRIVYILLLTLSGFSLFAQLHPANLKCEYLTNPEGIDIPDPRFYWQLKSGEEGQFQSAYQILVATSKEKLDQNKGDAFDSKKVKSNQNTHVVYKGKILEPASNYFWKVKVWDKNSKASEWSETATFSTGLFADDDWASAQWIGWKTQEEWEPAWWKRKAIEEQCHELHLPAYFGARMSLWERYLFHYENPYDPSPLMRKEFKAGKEIKSAKAFVAGIGYHELYINGKKVGDHVLDPGWTNYPQTVLYVSHDVSDYFRKGENAIGVMLGRGNYGLLANDHWSFWEKGGYIGQPKLKCRFRITYTDDTEEDIISDLSWKVTGGPVVYDDPHMGEIYDATKEVRGWNEPGIDTDSWKKVNIAPSPGGKLRAQLNEPIRVVQKTKPAQVETRGWKNEVWGDAGTNMAGWISIKVNAPKGTRISVYYGEMENVMNLDQPGGLQQSAYIAKGVPGEVATCRFSYKGFRYFLIQGHENQLTKDDIDVCRVNSDVTQVGKFECSDTTINAIHQ
jgi:alpha-L-rhamnosidase